MKSEQLPISAIVRCPLLAIRWQLPNKKIRRLQIRFKSDGDFDLVHSHLHHLGLRMMAPQGQSKDRVSAANSEPTTAATPPPVVPPQPAERAGPSCPPSRLSEISSRPYTAIPAPAAPEPYFQEATFARPSTAFATTARFPSSSPLNPPIYFQRPDSASDAISSTHDQPVATIERDNTSGSRPQSALLYSRPNTAELPPRRELPFSRDSLPTSPGSEANLSSSRPSTAIMGPPPLPSRVSDLRPSSTRAVGSDKELLPLRQPTIVGEAGGTPSASLRPTSPLTHLPGRSELTQAPVSTEGRSSFSQYSSSLEASPGPRIFRSAARPLTPVSGDVLNQDPAVSPRTYSTPSTNRDQNDRDPNLCFSDDAENQLKMYAMQSSASRKAALDDFILKNLNSDDFLTLVQDMEANCARIGLDKW
ncbi:hypothetical protein G6514_005992 [Epicoccum nigrum]|nr:hypothetical protein G6514_005992 [Epicoccum nigrum]